MMPTAIRPMVSQGRLLYGLGWPGRRSPHTGMASTATPMTGVTTHSQTFLRMPRRRSLAHSTTSATFAVRYMMISPRMPQVPRNPDAVPGLVNAVEMTPITMLGAHERDSRGPPPSEPPPPPRPPPPPQPP